ncbi:hypothetical protein FKV24_014610 [Lysobacter maris]|uniref:Uncharacterized protein n=1 Tax=Marilutibacter maris TaxID=1605891 RepID=A0A508A7J4_9GAMM|nr:hypothetical protein [Lysobacter maris]KAB8172515.1 hypothetical protein FKV24_014610 [Lysobacter maris]
MEPEVQADLPQIKLELLDGMRTYMHDVSSDGGDPGYAETDIVRCETILNVFLAKVASAHANDSDAVMAAVKEAVLAFNALNESCDHGLIETDQRELICELIIQAAAASGVGAGEDITEPWREW